MILVWLARRKPGLSPVLKRLATVAASLVALQIILGIATFKLHLQVEPLTITHQAVGASLLGVLIAFTVLAIRDKKKLSTIPEIRN